MSSQPTRTLRRERRAAALAQRRSVPRTTARKPRRIGIGMISAIAVVGGLALIAVLLVLGGGPRAAQIAVTRSLAPAGIASAGYVLGDPAAPVTIDLYEDFQCPACLRWGENVFPSVARNELTSGTVKIVFHSFAFIGPESKAAGRAAWAAGQQGRFWDLWATLYANQGLHENDGSFARDRLIAMADVIGLDPVRFATDLDSAAATAWVADGVAAATAAGVDSTPTVVVDGQAVTGGYTELAAAIAAAAAR